MGAQPLYGLRDVADQPRQPSPTPTSETFGIRTVTTCLIGARRSRRTGSRQFLVNGVPFVFRAGGWSEDLFLRYSSANTANQIAMIKNLGLNGIRTEGKQMPDDFYEQMDRAGILIDGGLPVLRRLADPQATADAHARLPVSCNSALTIGAEPAQPPERVQLQLERQRADPDAGGGLAARLRRRPTSRTR